MYDVFKSEEPKFRCPTIIRYNPVESGGTKKNQIINVGPLLIASYVYSLICLLKGSVGSNI